MAMPTNLGAVATGFNGAMSQARHYAIQCRLATIFVANI